jgi:DNA-binding protein YbaB
MGDLKQLQQQAGELDARLAAVRHTGRSVEGLVTVVVTGQGKLVDLRIDDRALYGPHAQKLGPGIVEAIRTARASSLPQLSALFGKAPPHPVVGEHEPTTVAGARPAPPVREPEHRHGEAVEDENFEEFDFLTDEGAGPGGGRW